MAAAGNEGLNNDYWAHYPSSYELSNVISVGAHDYWGDMAYFSNYGQYSVDVMARGVWHVRGGRPVVRGLFE